MVPKAYAYITRRNGDATELLVFTQPNDPDSGIQVPGGTMDEGETPEQAVLREVMEESGLADLSVVTELARTTYFHKTKQEWHERYYFHVSSAGQLHDTWEYTVSSGTNDKGKVFSYSWMPLGRANELACLQGEAAEKLV